MVEDVTSDDKKVDNKKVDDFIDDNPVVNLGAVISVNERNPFGKVNSVDDFVESKKEDSFKKVENKNVEPLTIDDVFEQKGEVKRKFFDNYKIVGQVFKTYWIIKIHPRVFCYHKLNTSEKCKQTLFLYKTKSWFSSS